MHSLSRSSRFLCSDTKGPTFSCWKPNICCHNRFCCCERVRIIFLILFFTMVIQHKLLQVLTGEKPGYKSPSVRILLPLKCTISKEVNSTSLVFHMCCCGDTNEAASDQFCECCRLSQRAIKCDSSKNGSSYKNWTSSKLHMLLEEDKHTICDKTQHTIHVRVFLDQRVS